MNHDKSPRTTDGQTHRNYSDAIEKQQHLADTHFQSAAVYWKAIYEDRDLQSQIYQQRREVILDMIDEISLPTNAHILEVGCGAGYTTVELARRGHRIEAIDTVPDMLELTQNLALEHRISDRVKTSIGDTYNLHFPDDSFDFAVAMGVLPWLQSPLKAIREMHRVLKPSGFIIITADNRWRLNHILDPFLNPLLVPWRSLLGKTLRSLGLKKPVGEGAHVYMHSTRQVDGFLQATGFERMNGVTVGFGPFSFFGKVILPNSAGVKLNEQLQILADRGVPGLRLTGSHYIILAKKPRTG
ncbi:MAG: class I SAM-dependent methyltransferase [Ignavibacteria bacterium]|nr:class I SAM-dependent methyltransferase [Ignavibacteria bacterium]